MRITKRLYTELGGMRNPYLYRVQRRGRWYYHTSDLEAAKRRTY